jgi:thiol-disulfide isomerase/thioredoxin
MNIEDSMQLQFQILINKKDSTFLNYVKANPKSEVALWHLFYKAYYGNFKSIYKTTYNYFDDKFKKSKRGIELQRILELGSKTVIGELFPTLTLLNTKELKKQIIPRSSNKYTLIDIWFSSCGPCLGQFKDLKAIFEKYRNKGFSIIGISVDSNEKKSDWLNVIAKYGLEWPQYWDVDGKEINKLNIHAFPMNFLLDKYGKILKKDMSPAEVDTFLNKQILYN